MPITLLSYLEWLDNIRMHAFYIIGVVCLLNVALDAIEEVSGNVSENNYPSGDHRRCIIGTVGPSLLYAVIPGGGWDNLRNRDMGRIMAVNYSLCRTTDDGKFLVPDGVLMIPLKTSRIETSAELFEHWDDFRSTLSRSVNLFASFKSFRDRISGKFSQEYESIKQRQYYYKTMTTRVQARYLIYNSLLEARTILDETFKARVLMIAAHITLNQTDLAQYESQLLVRDYGTHVITNIDVGAALVQVDELTAKYMKKYDLNRQTIEASASGSFFRSFDFFFGVDNSQTSTVTNVNEYRQERISSKIFTYGGPVYRPKNFSASQWSDSLQNDLVAIDRSGDPIYYFINEVTLPQVPRSVVYDTYDYVKEAVELYYEHNTHRGCTSEDAPNFSFQANVDDGSCKPPRTNFTFGGVYQTCSGSLCQGLDQRNPQTGNFGCPSGYEAVLLQSGTKYVSRRSCYSCWLFFRCCRTYHSSATYFAYWCAATGEIGENSGFLFGGLYTSTVNNAVTQAQSCPEEFYPLRLLGDLTVCVSDDYELGYKNSLPFAGFYTCRAGNPLAMMEKSNRMKTSGQNSMLTSYMNKAGIGNYPMNCPEMYSQHLALVHRGCSIYYCIQAGALSDKVLPHVQRPPFMEAPRLTEDENQTMVLDDSGSLWTNSETADKDVPAFMAAQGLSYPGTTEATYSYQNNGKVSESGESNSGAVAAFSTSAILVCVVVGAGVVFIVWRRRRRE